MLDDLEYLESPAHNFPIDHGHDQLPVDCGQAIKDRADRQIVFGQQFADFASVYLQFSKKRRWFCPSLGQVETDELVRIFTHDECAIDGGLSQFTADFCFQSGLSSVANSTPTLAQRQIVGCGELAGVRTQDLRIKSPLLYQLSYQPIPVYCLAWNDKTGSFLY